jgi:hypothetical protein
MTDNSRRGFFSEYFLHQAGRCLKGFEDGLAEARQKAEFDRFFESYESSYALTLAYPDDILLATARKYDIETENRSKKDIVKELFIKKGGF